MEVSIIIESLPLYFKGLVLTIQLVGLSLFFGLILAVVLVIFVSSPFLFLRLPSQFFVYFFRGTPMLIQLFIVYYGLGQFSFIREGFFWPFFREAYNCALLTFTFNTAAYTSEILRGAILTSSTEEIEAGKAFGMTQFLIFYRIIFPSAWRRFLPNYGNEIVFLLHGSAIASVITLMDLTGVARNVNSKYFSPYEAFTTAAIFYLAITFLIISVFKILEHKFLKYLKI